MKKILTTIVFLCLFLTGAQSKEVKVLLGFSPGGATSVLALKYIEHLNPILNKKGINLVPEYRPGAGGRIAIDLLSKESKELKLLFTSNSIITNSAMNKISNDTMQRIQPMAYAGYTPMIIVTGNTEKSQGLENFTDLLSKNNVGKINFAHGGVGSTMWAVTLTLEQIFGQKFNLVPYKGSGPATVDVMSGYADAVVSFQNSLTPKIKAGKLKPLIVLTDKRLPEYPDVQSFGEFNKGTFPVPIWWGFYSNKDQDSETYLIIKKAIAQLVNEPTFKEQLSKMYVTNDQKDIVEYFDKQLVYMRSLNLLEK